ncbi:MAG: glycosyltransferase family 2 protein [Bacteroidetes bacterium]|nr:glycosyltransferase family 2 protein [Bacteroidota bacterium]MBU1718327.1 glycosyltransferase family 2 protein [Bacteroidota bacterium]
MKTVSIVVPVCNSAEILPELYIALRNSLDDRYQWNLVMIDDGSKDATWKVVCELAANSPNISALKLRKNFGQDNAIMAGLHHVAGDFVVVMDDDLQHNPADIPALVETLANGFDVCYGRFVSLKQSNVRNSGSRMNGRIASWLLDKPRHIYLSPFKAMTAAVVADIIQFQGPFPYIDGIILALTSNITQCDVEHHQRASGKSNYNFRKSFGVALRHATGFSVAPLRMASLIGAGAAIVGFLLGIYYLMEFFFTDHIVEGWTSLVILLIFFGGLILLSLGLIGEYVGRTYLLANRKPQFTIAEWIKAGNHAESAE